MFPQIQIQIKYLKPKSFNGYIKPLGGLSRRQGVHKLFMTTKGQINGNFHFAWRLITRDTEQSLETVRFPPSTQADGTSSESPAPS